MLIEYGNTVVLPEWELNEKEATGYLRVYFVQEGLVLYEGSGQRCMLKAGMLYVFPNTVPYQARLVDGTQFVCTYLHINPKSVQINGLIELPVQPNTTLYYYVYLLQAAIQENRIEFLEAAAEQVTYFCRESRYYEDFSEFLMTVRHYVFEHISERITIEQLSGLFHYHPNYFIDLFKKETKCTPYQYLLRIRMQQALVLMRHNGNLSEIAEQVGYADCRSFTRAFVRYYGISPGAWRSERKNIP